MQIMKYVVIEKAGNYLKINISKIKDDDRIKVDLETKYDVPKEYCIDSVVAKFNGEIVLKDKIYHLKGVADCELEACCSTCLTAVKQKFDFEVVETFAKTEYDEYTTVLDGHEIDVDEQVYRNLIMNLPLKVTCKDDCKGLCNVCGTNLNGSNCDCESKGQINPKFEKLLSFYNDESN